MKCSKGSTNKWGHRADESQAVRWSRVVWGRKAFVATMYWWWWGILSDRGCITPSANHLGMGNFPIRKTSFYGAKLSLQRSHSLIQAFDAMQNGWSSPAFVTQYLLSSRMPSPQSSHLQREHLIHVCFSPPRREGLKTKFQAAKH